MKKILIILLGIVIFQSCIEVVIPDEDVHYINEDFMLLDKFEENMVINGNTIKVRTWKIQRITINGDSVMVAEIDDKEANGCSCGIITDELWHKRNVGDILHFDYIRKDRFFSTKNTIYGDLQYTNDGSMTITTTEPVVFTTINTAIINLSKIQIESRILEIDREIMSLERELEMLKESQK